MFSKFTEARVATEAAKFAEHMSRKLEAERDQEIDALLTVAKKTPIIVSVENEEYILYSKDGKSLELATPDKMEPIFRSMEELGKYIAAHK